MTNCRYAALPVLGMLMACSGASAAVVTFSGSLTTAGGGLLGNAGGDWLDSPGSTLSWTVSRDTATSDPWTYSYTLTVPDDPSISHLILEASGDFDESKISDIVFDLPDEEDGDGDIEIGNQFSGGSNPGMPDDIFGIKFEDLEEPEDGSLLTITITFQSPRDPVWGDFYAKGGSNNSSGSRIWNAGFTAGDTDPASPPANGSIANHLLVPDTTELSVPEPASLALIALGGAALLRSRRCVA